MTKRAAALGFFDGVHLGHAALLHTAAEEAARRGLVSAVVTLDRYPAAAVGGEPAPLINAPADREYLIRACYGISEVVDLPFDETLQHTAWSDFAAMLLGELDCGLLVCGYDYRFGRNGAGNASLLRDYAAARGADCIVVPRVSAAGGSVSSTRIRSLIAEGAMEEATALLGHPHLLSGTIVHGRRLGHRLGVPTANLLIPPGVVEPAYGVYASRTEIDGVCYDGVTNIGRKPTVAPDDPLTVETHLFGWPEGLEGYGKEVRLWLYARLRPERRFADLEALARQMRRDGEAARAWFAEHDAPMPGLVENVPNLSKKIPKNTESNS